MLQIVYLLPQQMKKSTKYNTEKPYIYSYCVLLITFVIRKHFKTLLRSLTTVNSFTLQFFCYDKIYKKGHFLKWST